MATLAFLGIAAFAAVIAFGLVVATVRRYPPVGAGLACLFLVTLWELPYPPPIVTLSGLSVYPADLVVLVLVVAGALELRQLQANLGGWFLLWALFGTSIAVSLLIGIATFGAGTSFNAARSIFFFFCAMTWALSVRPDRLRLHTVSLFLGWALVLVAVYHGARFGFGGPATYIAVGDLVRNGRVLISSQAMALLLCAATVILGPPDSRKVRSQFYALSSLVFGGVVVISQHRSVWAAGALGVVAVWVWSTQRRARTTAFVLLVLGTWAGLIVWSSGILDESEWFDSASSTGTYEWRTQSWQLLISQTVARGPLTVLIGAAFGGDAFLRRHAGGISAMSLSSHNWYVEIFVSLGVIGLVALFPMFFSALAKSRGLPAIWTFILAATAAYGWAYAVDWFFAPWLGVAITVSLRAGRTEEGSALGLIPSADAYGSEPQVGSNRHSKSSPQVQLDARKA